MDKEIKNLNNKQIVEMYNITHNLMKANNLNYLGQIVMVKIDSELNKRHIEIEDELFWTNSILNPT